MNYEYMKEYEHKGCRPNLNSGVNIELYCSEDDEWYPSRTSEKTMWSDWDKFRIVDERYKPKSDADIEQDKALTLDELSKIEGAYDKGKSYLCVNSSNCVYLKGRIYETNGCGIVDEFDRGGSISSCRTGRSSSFTLINNTKSKSDWFERGELPPVGERVVRAHNGDTVKVLAHGTAGVICVKDEEDYLYLLARCDNDFLPLKTKRDEVIEEAYKISDLSTSWKESLGKLYDAGMLKKQEDKYE